MKTIFTTSALAVAALSTAGAQGLYNIASLDDSYDSSPLSYTVGVGYTYDDNVAPLSGDDEDASSIEAFVRANLSHADARTQWTAYLQVGYLAYLDDVDSLSSDGYLNVFGGFDLTHRINERLRYVTRNSVQRALEPDYSIGISNSRLQEPYTLFSTDHAIGYRWTQRLATYTGVNAQFIKYDDDLDILDRDTIGFYHDFRYQLSPKTVATLGYRYSQTDANGFAGDSTNQFITAGLEHRFSPLSVVTLRAGVQLRDVDNGEDSSNPFVEAGIQTRLAPLTTLRGYVRYSSEDYATSFPTGSYDNVLTLRAGLQLNHQLSQKVNVYAGIDYIDQSYEDSPNGLGDLDEQLVNYNVGLAYQINQTFSLTGTYNFSDLSSDDDAREYDRNRFTVGVQAQF